MIVRKSEFAFIFQIAVDVVVRVSEKKSVLQKMV